MGEPGINIVAEFDEPGIGDRIGEHAQYPHTTVVDVLSLAKAVTKAG
jgi:hypothetical protein